MEECKRMGIKVLGPDLNESQQGFAVNKKGEIRFGFSGLKGVGENAIDSIIEERQKGGHFSSVIEFLKRINLKACNKKSMENLIYSGAFDCFTDMHRAQYFYQPAGDNSNLEKLLKFASVFQSQSNQASNTLFGDLQMPDIVPPKLPTCDPWQLVVKLDHEKEITGMYMSGHPLDNFRFEMEHYQIHAVEDFNEIKTTIQTHPNTRTLRLAGMIIDPQHRLTKAGKQFASFHLEDYTGKTEFLLWNEDYVKYSNYLENGRIVMIEGNFRQRFNTSPYEFKVSKFHLLDTVKSTLTKQVILEMQPNWIDEPFVDFVENNIKLNPGKTSLKINVYDMQNQRKISLSTLEKGFTLNDDFIHFLGQNAHIKTQIALQNG